MRRFIYFPVIVCLSLAVSFTMQWLLKSPPVVRAATFTVTKTVDTADGVCDSDCSLREAIIAANADPNPDTITLSAGTYVLTIPHATGNNQEGDLDILTDMTLVGAGPEQTIIDGRGFPADARDAVLHIRNYGLSAGLPPSVTISGVTIQNGKGGIYAEQANITVRNSTVISNVSYSYEAGGIAIIVGTLTVEDSLIAKNRASSGAGIWGVTAAITITNTIIENNQAINSGNPAVGGGIYTTDSSSVAIGKSKIRNNIATRSDASGGCGGSSGGGIYFYGNGASSFRLLDSEVVSNTATDQVETCTIAMGGGINLGNNEITLIQNSLILSNTSGMGGGIVNATYGSSHIVNSTISYNRAIAPPAAFSIDGMAGGISASPIDEIINSTLSHNSATADGGGIYGNVFTITHSTVAYNTAGGYGGGIFGTPNVLDSSVHHNSANNGGGMVLALGGRVERSTLYENVATQEGGGIYLLYGARLGESVIYRIFNSTLSSNHAKNGGAFSDSGASKTAGGDYGVAYTMFHSNTAFGNSATNSAGGLYHHECCGIEVENSIVADNGLAGDCSGESEFVSLGYNLAGDSTCIKFNATGDAINTDPLLGPLQDNGGPSPTHALALDSPARESGNSATCFATDQRGIIRPQGLLCDIGAFELVPVTPFLYVTPTVLQFEGQLDTNQTLTQSFDIRNAGGGILDWTIHESTPWLTVSPTSGFDHRTLAATVTTNGLNTGSYDGVITVESPGASGSPQTIHVSLSVNRQAVGIVTPATGGTLQIPGGLNLTFPPTAVGGITTVTVTLISLPTHPLQFDCASETCRYAGVAVELNATDGDGNQISFFNQPYTLVLPYDPSFLTNAGIASADTLQWFEWQTDQWDQAFCDCSVDTSTNKFITKQTSVSEYALFGIQTNPTHTLTINKTGSGDVTLEPPGGSYSPGTKVKLTATPTSGFTFAAWSGAVSGTTNPTEVTMDGDKTVNANFVAIAQNFSVIVNKIGEGTVMLNPPGEVYAQGTVVQLTAIPASDSIFTNWSGEVSGNVNPIHVTVTRNLNVVANFAIAQKLYLPIVSR
ncbi:MAG: choice-of-anchor Q domain-containing protein [Caldilineaceae bacterium]